MSGRKHDDTRRVHGLSMSGRWEVVRYDRAGKWYLEPLDEGQKRVRVTLDHAATTAAVGTFHPNLPGGQSFDRAVREKRRS